MRLVYISPVKWASFQQRPHKFVDWFHRKTGGEVLWVEPYPTRLPTMEDFLRIFEAGKNSEISQSPFWLKTVRPYVLPIEPISQFNFINQFLWKHVIDIVRDFTSDQNALIVIGKPSAIALDILIHFKNIPSIYDAMDLFPAFYKGISQRSMAKIELKVANMVDTVWASSTDLASHWEGQSRKVHIVRNGFDSSLLTSNTSRCENTDRKIFGYVGTISTWFDWNFVIKLAQERKDDLIRVVGPLSRLPAVKLPKNIELLPACDHQTAMNLMHQFDVGLIPFLKTKLTDYVDPIKYYEYRAIGMPVLSTAFGEMRYKFEDPGVFLLTTHRDIASMAEVAVKFGSDAEKYDQFSRHFSWDARFNGSGIFLD